MIFNMTNFDLTRPVTPNKAGEILKWIFFFFFFADFGSSVSLDLSQRVKHNGVTFVALEPIARKLLKKNVRFEKSVWLQ